MSGRRLASAATVLALAAAFAADASGKKPGPTQPTGPTNLRITASSTYSISLAWDAARGGSSNWWYCVQVNGAGCFRVDPPSTTFTYTNLMPGRTTSWTVITVDSNGNRSAPSNSVTFTTPPDTTAPSAPTLSLVAARPTRITVAWTDSKDDTSQVSYTLFVDGSVEPTAYASPATILYLTPGTTHEFRVTARDSFGNAVQSNVLSVTTPAATDTVAPSAPTNVTLGFQSSSPEAWLNWTQSTDATDPQSEILYEVYFDGVLHRDDGVIGYPSTVAYCREASGPVAIVLRAVDPSGNVSPPSNEVAFDC
jgi:fibronectin type III domain protein